MLIEKTFSSVIQFVPSEITELLSDFRKKVQLSDQDHLDLTLLLEEALTNAIKYGSQFDPNKSVHCTMDYSDGVVTIRIKDQGIGFNHRVLPDVVRNNEIMKQSGRGIHLMKTLADEVSFNEQGNEICIRKRIQS